MRRTPTLAALVLAVQLSACATLETAAPNGAAAPSGASGSAVARSGPSPTAARAPAFDWPAARAQLERTFAGAPDIVTSVRDDGALLLLVPGADAFARGRTELAPALGATLDRIAAALVGAPRTRVHVFGHTDSMGRELYNLQLSIRRAEAVSEHLRVRGIPLARLTADGRGEAEPIADNATEDGRARNRRVEIVVLPPE